MEKPFYERYPSEFKEKDGASVFSETMYISEMHDKHLPEYYFPTVMQVNTFPRYRNQRGVDPQVRMYLDQTKTDLETNWGLPVPNAEAAYISMGKYAKDILPMTPIQVKSMNMAWDWTERQFAPYMKNAQIRSLEEAVGHLDMSTSSGFPFNTKYPKKKDLFEQMPTIMQWLEEDWSTLATDPDWTSVFKNSLKEELRTAEKLAANSIRTFTAAAVDASVHGNRLFGDMNDKMNNSFLKTASCIGMSPLKGNWDRLYKKLKRFRFGYALDESQYDSSLRAYMMWGCAQLRYKMLADEFRTPGNLQRIQTYYRNLINTLIISPEGVLVMKLTGNPSGSPNTINDNTLILYCLMAYAWIRTSPENEKSYTDFELNTSKCLVGDDNTWTVSDEAHEFYNARSVIAEWKIIGVTTTTDSLEPRAPKDLDFLSAKTVFYKGLAIPVYERSKLMTSLLHAKLLHLTPAKSLERAGGLMINGWSDLPMRKFTRNFVDWLIETYDEVCAQDPDWIVAKAGIALEGTLEDIYLGPQGFMSEPEERLISTIKSNMSNLKIVSPKNKNTRQRRSRGASKGGKVTQKSRKFIGPRQLVVVQQAKPKRRNRRNPQKDYTGVYGTKNRGNGLTRTHILEEDEYIGEVNGVGTPFNTTQYAVNIGQVATFPWGSTIAKNYEKYEFDFLEFYYKHEVSQFATLGSAGKVIMSFDSDASDGAPTTKQQQEDQYPHADSMPSENLVLRVPKQMLKAMNDAHYVRPGGLPGQSDIKTYDVGNFFISTQGLTSTGIVGELHVRYRCRLSIPILGSATLAAPTNNSVSLFANSGPIAMSTGISFVPSVNTPVVNGLTAINNGGIITLAPGNYMIDANVGLVSAGGVFTLMTLNLVKNATVISDSVVVFAGTAGCSQNEMYIAPYFVSMNGTDTISLSSNNAFTGSGTYTGTFRIVAL